jgi:hypothetical protein
LNTLQAPPGSPWWLQAGAAALLFAHIAGGSLALIAGAAALALRKGSPRHALAGTLFFGAMLTMAAIGAAVSPLLPAVGGDRRWFDSLGGIFALYLVATGWATVRRKAGTTGAFEIAAALFAALAAAGAAGLAMAAAQRPGGTLAGYGADGYGIFAALFALAGCLDLGVILRGGVAGIPRLARHLWRMCAALFIAAGSFFFGQQQVMPDFVQGSPWLAVPPFAVLGLMVFWLAKLRLPRRVNRFARTAAA